MTAAEQGAATAARPPRSRAVIAVVAIIAVVVAALVAFSIGRLTVASLGTPGDTSADAGFSRDMQVHHLQGVEMAMIIRDLSDSDDVRLLAYDIATTQAQQAGQLYGWLSQWGLSQAGSEPAMTWMTVPVDGATHAHSDEGHQPGDPMPGLATPEQMNELRASTGVDAEVMFLELMIAHHKGAVEMAEAALDRAHNVPLLTLANGIVKSQTAEISLMESMLAERT